MSPSVLAFRSEHVSALENQQSGPTAASEGAALPLVVDLDGTLLRTDTLHEGLAAAFFKKPLAALLALGTLFRRGKAAFKREIAALAPLDVASLPPRRELVEFLEAEHLRRRPIHLATAADRTIAEAIAERFPFVESVNASDRGENLKGAAKARRLKALFPQGFAYAGDCAADLEVWRHAASAIVVERGNGLSQRVQAMGVPVERVFRQTRFRFSAWLKALRVYQWSKNALVMVPLALGWPQVTGWSLGAAVLAMFLLCFMASLTYCVNDIADLASDRRHWSKMRRPFASGAILVQDGMVAAAVGIPVILGLGFLIAPAVAGCLAVYLGVTLAYSFGLKQVPILDTFIIATLFTLRLALGIAAATLAPSSWLLTFSMFFFFSLAVAKRHTEVLRAGKLAGGPVKVRGYHVEDKDLLLALGTAAGLAAVLIIVIYLVNELFGQTVYYRRPEFLWVAPCTVFLWVSRVWLLAHRGLMRDDPVVFALRDRVSMGLGALTAIAFILAVF